jgi:hypothetical protein
MMSVFFMAASALNIDVLFVSSVLSAARPGIKPCVVTVEMMRWVP